MEMDLPEIVKSLFATMSDAINILKGAKDLLPAGKQRDALEKRVAEADRLTKLGEAQIAKALGYHLCQCTDPPQVMLSQGYHGHSERFQCPNCKKAWPGPAIKYPEDSTV